MLSKSLMSFLSYLPTIHSSMGDKYGLYKSLTEVSPKIFTELLNSEDIKKNVSLLNQLTSREVRQIKNLLVINSPKFGELVKFWIRPDIKYLPHNMVAIIYDRQYDKIFLIKPTELFYQIFTVEMVKLDTIVRKTPRVNADKVLKDAFRDNTKTFINIDMNIHLPYEILSVISPNTEALSW